MNKITVTLNYLPIPEEEGGVDKGSPFYQNWPGHHFVDYVNEQLILAIPPQYYFPVPYLPFWGRKPEEPLRLGESRKLDLIPHTDGSTGFAFHLPNFTAYDSKNIHIPLPDDNVVFVGSFRSVPPETFRQGAIGFYFPNVWEGLRYPGGRSEAPIRSEFGLDRYSEGNGETDYCIPSGVPISENELFLRVRGLQSLPISNMPDRFKAIQVSKRYGGVELRWSASHKNLSKWKEIDTAIWSFIDRWNIAGKLIK
jgi:hypothetical protein